MSAVVSEAVRREVEDFLYREAHLLDSGAYREWLRLLHPDVVYKIPIRTVQSRELEAAMPEWANHVDDDFVALEMRVQRLECGYAWAEEPPSRVRRFVTNLRIVPRARDGEVEAHSSLLVSRTRGDDPTVDLFPGERHDVLCRADGEWKLLSRIVRLDPSTLGSHLPTIL